MRYRALGMTPTAVSSRHEDTRTANVGSAPQTTPQAPQAPRSRAALLIVPAAIAVANQRTRPVCVLLKPR